VATRAEPHPRPDEAPLPRFIFSDEVFANVALPRQRKRTREQFRGRCSDSALPRTRKARDKEQGASVGSFPELHSCHLPRITSRFALPATSPAPSPGNFPRLALPRLQRHGASSSCVTAAQLWPISTAFPAVRNEKNDQPTHATRSPAHSQAQTSAPRINEC